MEGSVISLRVLSNKPETKLRALGAVLQIYHFEGLRIDVGKVGPLHPGVDTARRFVDPHDVREDFWVAQPEVHSVCMSQCTIVITGVHRRNT